MIVLVSVCILTAALFVWLLVEFGRADRGGLAVARLGHGAVGAGSAAEAPAVAEKPSPEASAIEEAAQPAADHSWVRHDVVVEEQVRRRLYGEPRRR